MNRINGIYKVVGHFSDSGWIIPTPIVNSLFRITEDLSILNKLAAADVLSFDFRKNQYPLRHRYHVTLISIECVADRPPLDLHSWNHFFMQKQLEFRGVLPMGRDVIVKSVRYSKPSKLFVWYAIGMFYMGKV